MNDELAKQLAQLEKDACCCEYGWQCCAHAKFASFQAILRDQIAAAVAAFKESAVQKIASWSNNLHAESQSTIKIYEPQEVMGGPDAETKRYASHLLANAMAAIEALPAGTSALTQRIAQERLEEARWWYQFTSQHQHIVLPNVVCAVPTCVRITQLEAAAKGKQP